MDPRAPHHPLIAYTLYPVVVGGAILAASLAVALDLDRSAVMPAVLLSTIAICMLVEWRRPLDRRWSMTARSLGRRDLPFITLGLVIGRLSEIAIAAIVTRTLPDGGFGPIGALPVGLQTVGAILLFDLAWYSYHRLAHRRPRLWRIHGAHHTPQQLYVLMHGVFHPGDELVVRFVLALAVFRLGGFSPDAVFIALATIGTIGIISHLNADVRIGALTHLLIGPETHRYPTALTTTATSVPPPRSGTSCSAPSSGIRNHPHNSACQIQRRTPIPNGSIRCSSGRSKGPTRPDERVPESPALPRCGPCAVYLGYECSWRCSKSLT